MQGGIRLDPTQLRAGGTTGAPLSRPIALSRRVSHTKWPETPRCWPSRPRTPRRSLLARSQVRRDSDMGKA
jgi:hypothetical protein